MLLIFSLYFCLFFFFPFWFCFDAHLVILNLYVSSTFIFIIRHGWGKALCFPVLISIFSFKWAINWFGRWIKAFLHDLRTLDSTVYNVHTKHIFTCDAHTNTVQNLVQVGWFQRAISKWVNHSVGMKKESTANAASLFDNTASSWCIYMYIWWVWAMQCDKAVQRVFIDLHRHSAPGHPSIAHTILGVCTCM